MGAEITQDWRAIAASALEWWRDAGVDTLTEDLPRDWFAAAPPRAPAAAEPPPAVAVASPHDLPRFLAWRTGPDAPEATWPGPSFAASGAATSGVMILIDCPDRDDAAEGALLSGAAGRLFDRMLAAIGLTRDSVHLAPVLAKRPLGPVDPAVEARVFELAQRHAALVAPKRLLLMGGGASRAILGTDVARSRGSLRSVNQAGAQLEVVASWHPRSLIERPALKAQAWEDLQLLIGGMTQ